MYVRGILKSCYHTEKELSAVKDTNTQVCRNLSEASLTITNGDCNVVSYLFLAINVFNESLKLEKYIYSIHIVLITGNAGIVL